MNVPNIGVTWQILGGWAESIMDSIRNSEMRCRVFCILYNAGCFILLVCFTQPKTFLKYFYFLCALIQLNHQETILRLKKYWGGICSPVHLQVMPMVYHNEGL